MARPTCRRKARALALTFVLVGCLSSHHGAAVPPGVGAPPGTTVSVTLVPAPGGTGRQRVNFAVPLPPGLLEDARAVRVRAGERQLPAARRGLARHPDGSLRSVQLQVELDVGATRQLTVDLAPPPIDPRALAPVDALGRLAGRSLPLAPVDSTLAGAGDDTRPRVWALLPAEWLAHSGVAGPLAPHGRVADTALDAWGGVCDYGRHDTAAFLAAREQRGAWLYDRVTAMYRGYARTGDLGPLESAYREAHIYREGIAGTGDETRIGVPGADDDLKYHYTQGMAIHYLLTGDERFREAAEKVALRAAALWPRPGYEGGRRFWTERNAGFALLAYVWAAKLSGPRADRLGALADDAVRAYLATQERVPPGHEAGSGHDDRSRRCFAHEAEAHGESFGYPGCSPWMSAILAEGLDAYATLRGGEQGAAARAAIVKLGRILAERGLDSSGKPYYWMGVGTARNEVDPHDEHHGEPAYVIAMAWYHDGRTDRALRAAAESLIARLAARGRAPHLRSFNWQCRSAPMAQWYLAHPARLDLLGRALPARSSEGE